MVAICRVVFFAVLFALLGWPGAAQAHPFHVSIAEAEFNAKTGRLEVAMRVHPVDLERALSRMTGQRISLEKTKNIDQLIAAYLAKVVKFQLEPDAAQAANADSAKQPRTSPATEPPEDSEAAKHSQDPDRTKPQPQKLIWVGKEVSVKTAWLYFEVPLPKGPEGVQVTHTLFHELLDDQANTLVVKSGDVKTTVTLTRGKPTQRLSFETPLPAARSKVQPSPAHP